MDKQKKFEEIMYSLLGLAVASIQNRKADESFGEAMTAFKEGTISESQLISLQKDYQDSLRESAKLSQLSKELYTGFMMSLDTDAERIAWRLLITEALNVAADSSPAKESS